METAEHVARVFGTELRYVRSDSSSGSMSSGKRAYQGRQTSTTYAERVAPALAPTELDALPASAVVVLAQADRQYRVLAERLNPIPKLASLPPPPLGRHRHPSQVTLVASTARATPSHPDGNPGQAAASVAPTPAMGERGEAADGYFLCRSDVLSPRTPR
jgi:hypothetical protein